MNIKPFFSFTTLLSRTVLLCAWFCGVGILPANAQSSPVEGGNTVKARIMIVGVAHFATKSDIHQSPSLDVMAPEQQRQIETITARLAQFHPTKVMIEKPFGEPQWAQQYADYRKGKFALKANEIYQLGFRLAGLVNNATIYPIDQQGFPFDYEAVQAYAKAHGQEGMLDRTDQNWQHLAKREDEIARQGNLLRLLQYLNTPEAIRENASSYMLLDRIGGGKEYPGADLVSFWYARNLHIFANMTRDIDSENDRVVVFIGQGHARLLRAFIELSPDFQLVDPEKYLGQ